MTAAKLEVAVRMIPLDLLDENPLNPRRSMDDAALQELAQSIRQSGILQPLSVRPETIDGLVEERYEIVCGHRRAQAATIAELLEVPCIVREMTDQEAAEIALVDNLQRVDVAALDEAEAFAALLQIHGSIEAVAKRVGKEIGHVAKRLKLQTLTLHSRDSLREKLITVDHALLLARLGSDDQNAALKWLLDSQAGVKKPLDKVYADRLASCRKDDEDEDRSFRMRTWEPVSPLRLKEHIEQTSGRKLSRAPWDLDAVMLPVIQVCSICPSNTNANTALFSDLAIEEATCADGLCFERKRAAFVALKLRTATDDMFPPLRVSWKLTSVKPRMMTVKDSTLKRDISKPDEKQLFKAGQWIEAKPKSCAHVRSAVTVDWNDDANRGYMSQHQKLRKPGELLTVCVEGGCKAHRKAWEETRNANANSAQPKLTPEQVKKLQEEEKHVVKVEYEIRNSIFRSILEKLDTKRAIQIVADECHDAPEVRKQLLSAFPKISGDQLEAFVVFADCFRRAIAVNSYWLMNERIKQDREDMWKLAKSVGVDADAVTLKYFEESGCADWSQRLVPGKKKFVAKKAPKKPAKKAAAPAAKKTAKKTLSAEARKRIVAATKKRWTKQKTKKTTPFEEDDGGGDA